MHRSFVGGIAAGLVFAGVVAAFLASRGGDDEEPRRIALPARTVAAGDLRPKVEDDYEKFSAAGNRALQEIMERAATMLAAGASRQEVLDMIKPRWAQVAERHEETWDTAVRDAFAVELDRLLEAAGFEPLDAHSDFTDLF